MKTYNNPDKKVWAEVLKRPTSTYQEIEGLVSDVFEEIRKEGDEGVRKYVKKFDGAELSSLEVSVHEMRTAAEKLSPALKDSIRLAHRNIEKFHSSQKTEKVEVETFPGVQCWQEKRPIEKVGLYIPGGTAPLFSTVLMLAVPAKIAGCQELVLCSPSDRDGNIHPAILFTADLCGVDRVYKVGGIQAIAAMTFGTESIPAVYKLFGPGNQYVTVAKQMALKYGVAIDLPAGPSELLVLADESADPAFVASDLLSQAEHGIDSQVVLVTLSKELQKQVDKEIQIQMEVLPRKEIAARAIENSKSIFMESAEEALDLVNAYAPEHLIICLEDRANILSRITNAGSVFVGNYTPESAGDYASGTNHTLPTNGFARNFSGVNLDSFQKAITFQEISRTGLQGIGAAIEEMAEAEGLMAHKNAVSLRLEKIRRDK
jgi:histidinol dehydrogenase